MDRNRNSINLTEFLGKASSKRDIVEFMKMSGWFVTEDLATEMWVHGVLTEKIRVLQNNDVVEFFCPSTP